MKIEKKDQIINAATQEFLAQGLSAASMQRISDLAGVSKRTLYKYYPSKDALYNALIDEILDRMENMYEFTYSDNEPLAEQIKKIIDAKIKLTLTDSFINISKIIIGGLLKSRMPTPNQMQRLNQSEDLFIKWIKKGQDDGKIVKDLDAVDIATQFHAILKGQIYWPVLMGLKTKSSLDLNNIKKTTLTFFLKSFCLLP